MANELLDAIVAGLRTRSKSWFAARGLIAE
jgi:hypothetical protein